MTVTDPGHDETKQNVLVIGGQHGNEESGRAVCLALLRWLVTPAAAPIRKNQKVVVMPNVSPDAADLDQYMWRSCANSCRPCAPRIPKPASCLVPVEPFEPVVEDRTLALPPMSLVRVLYR